MANGSGKPRVIFYDLESIPDMKEAMKVFFKLSNYPGLTMKATHNSLLCFGYKVLGEKKPKIINAWDFPGWTKSINDDYDLVKAAYNILIEADCLVTQNGKAFDHKFLQTRLMHHGLPLLPKIQHIDTKLLAKRNLFLFNNSLDTMAKFMTKTEKMKSGGIELWVDVSNRDPKAMKKMADYCKQDVEALAQVFDRLLPFVKEMPNYNMFRRDGVEVCPNCGGHNIQKRGVRVTKEAKRPQGSCQDCGTWFVLSDKKSPKTL